VNKVDGFNTNLAAEFYVLSVLHRLGVSATITLGNKKAVDIVIARDAGDALTVDVKGLAGTTNWPIDNLKAGRAGHFIVFVTFLGKIGDPSVMPEVYIVPSDRITTASPVYRNPKGNRRVVQLSKVRTLWGEFKEKWDLLK